MNTFDEPCSSATQRTASYEAVMLRPDQGIREVTPSIDRETSSDIAAHNTRRSSKVAKRGASSTACNDKHQARPPTDHFKSLFEEACPNHAYPVRHKLKDCGMMRRTTHTPLGTSSRTAA
jgi:hypothetical protein